MCGIAGYSGNFEPELLDRMSEAIAHRGPDDHGAYFCAAEGIGLAHRRLSIIDLSPTGHQPMWDVSGRVAIVFNGEIYNYRKLREELRQQGFSFNSSSDTECLLNLYLQHGEDMLTRLNGIFAFAIWDTRSRSLFVARDGVGVKPLYYAECSKGFMFASELKALLLEPSVNRELDAEAVGYYLSYGYSPAPHTMLQSVQKLEPGHALRVCDGQVAKHWEFYDLPYDQPIAKRLPAKQAAEQLRFELRRAVERQMVADVPVGAFLSGGLDSSSVVTFAREVAGAQGLQCFTIAFKDASFRREGLADDLPYARRVAAHLDVDLNVVTVGPEMAEQFVKAVYHMEEPQADPATVNVLFITELARRHGMKVLLSGTGGDDLFTGYRRHNALERENLWGWLPKPLRAGIRAGASRVRTSSPLGRRLAKAGRYADLDGDERLISYFYWAPPEVIRRLYGPVLRERLGVFSPAAPMLEALRRLPSNTPAMNRMLYLDGKFFLTDHNLNYMDKMAMANGVEVRVPLLDPDVVAFAARLPLRFKQRDGVGKWILKKAMEPFLPRDIIYRPKAGFGAPLRHWLRHELRPLLMDVLSEPALARRGLFDPKQVHALIEQDRAGRIDGAYTVFTLLWIELWCRLFLDTSIGSMQRAIPGSRSQEAT